MQRRIAILLIALLVLPPAVPAFAKPPKPQRFTHQSEAGSAHVAVLSVIPWQDYAKELQPAFDLDETGALEAVEETSREMESTFTDSLAFALRLSGQAVPGTPKPDDATGGDDSDVDSGIPTREEIQAIAGALQLDKGSATLFPAAEKPTVHLDPMLKHQAATALYQEVKLLNQYVERAVQRTGYKPFIVRMQVTVLPSARREPYDTYATISFFAADRGEAPIIPASILSVDETKGSPNQAQDVKELLQQLPPDTSIRFNTSTSAANAGIDKNPVIVPLLVTDSIEATLHNQVTERIRQFAFSLLFLIKGWGSQSDFQKYSRDVEKVFGRDLNSLLTIGRVTDNTYRVRLGAMQQVAVNYATVPRNHYVTFLMLAPCELLAKRASGDDNPTATIQVVSKVEWLDAETGKQLSPRSRHMIARELRRDASSFAHYAGVSFKKTFLHEAASIWRFVHENKFLEFRDEVKKQLDSSDANRIENFPYEAFWLTMADIMSESRYGSTVFELPKERIPTLASATSLLALDDGTATMVRTGGTRLQHAVFDSTLSVKSVKKTCGQCDTYPFPLEKASVSSDGRVAALSFPSLAAWGLGPRDLEITLDTKIEPRGLDEPYCDEPNPDPQTLKIDHVPYLYKPKKDTVSPDSDSDKAGFKLKAISPRVVADPATGQGTADVSITFSTKSETDAKGKTTKVPLCEKAALEVVQPAVRGDIVVKPADARPDAAKLELVKDARLEIPLRNLSCGNPVQLKGKCLEGDKKGGELPLEIEVALYSAGHPCTAQTASTGTAQNPAPASGKTPPPPPGGGGSGGTR